MRASVLALVLTAALPAGCGGSQKTAQPNDEASKPALRVFADAKAAATSASSGRFSGNLRLNGTPVTFDLSTVRGKGATGSLSKGGLALDLIRIGDTVYIRGSDAFYKHFAGAALAQLLHGKWLKAPATHGRLEPLARFTSLPGVFAVLSSRHGKLVDDGKTTYKGTEVVAVRDLSDGSKLYVAATGKPYPVAIVGGKKGQVGAITFGDWNKGVSLLAPSGALDISQFGG